MKKLILSLVVVLCTFACKPSPEEKAQTMLTQIEQLQKEGRYKETLDSIKSLRKKYPQAMEARRKALKIWQEASLKITQADIAKTDSALQKTLAQIHQLHSPVIPTQLRLLRDSLQIRFDVLCATVRAIHKKQKE